MEISDTSYIITFISKTYGYNTVIFDPKENTGWEAIEKFIEEYKKAHPEYALHTQRMVSGTKIYKAKAASTFDELYGVVK